MDEINLSILKKLMENSRLTYRELAEKTDMTVSAIHKRIKRLEENEIISAYTAQPSVSVLKCIHVLIFGKSKAKSMDAVNKELGKHESVRLISITGGKYLFISGYLRNISELQDYSAYASKTAQISDPTVGIINLPYFTTPEPLTSIDYKILKSLNRDAKKSISDISDDVGLSAKTVRKRLAYMIENKLAVFSIQWYPHKDSFMTIFQLFLNEGTDINSKLQYLNEEFSQNIAYCFSYSNIPHLITATTWTKTAPDSQRIQETLQSGGFKDVIPHIILSANWYGSWVDQLLSAK